MEKKTNNFKQFLENYYSDTFTDPTGKEGKNSVFKVNNCIMDNIPMPANQIITLPSGCYSKMLTSDSLDVYGTCLQQFTPTQEQLELIRNCVKGGTPVATCSFTVSLEISVGGEVEYVDCCGERYVITLDAGYQIIGGCVQNGSVKSYEKGGNPATIDSIDYSKEKCDCVSQ
jgi:hypothetical protein